MSESACREQKHVRSWFAPTDIILADNGLEIVLQIQDAERHHDGIAVAAGSDGHWKPSMVFAQDVDGILDRLHGVKVLLIVAFLVRNHGFDVEPVPVFCVEDPDRVAKPDASHREEGLLGEGEDGPVVFKGPYP